MLECLEDRFAPASADLALTMSGPGTATAGTPITYTLTLTNNGPNAAAGVSLTDALPAGETLISETQLTGPDAFINTSSGNTASFTTTTSTFPFSGSGTSGTISIPPGSVPWSVQNDPFNPSQDSWGIPGLELGTTTWPAGTSANDFTVTFTNLPAGVVINPLPPPDLSPNTDATRFVDSTTPLVLWDRSISADGQSVTFTAPPGTPLNPGDPFFVNVVFTGHVDPSGVSFTGAFQSDVGMPSGNTDTFQVVAQIASSQPNGSSLTNTASVSSIIPDPDLTNNSASVTTSVLTSADLSVSKSGPALVTAGTSATYTITLTNNGPSDAQNVTVSDTLPDGLTVVSEAPISNPDGFTNTTTGNTPSFNAATMVSGNTDTFQVVAFAPSSLASGTPLSDTASVTASTFDPDLTNNTFTFGETVATSADLSVSKTGPVFITAGDSATYTITLTNLGPSDSAGVSLTDGLPAGLTLVSEKQIGGTDAFVDNSTGNTATFNAVTMVSGNTDTFVVVARADSGLVAGNTVTDTAMVSATTSDPDMTNNSSSVISIIATSADVSVSKTGPATITAGTSATYTITLTNLGPSDSQNVNLTDTLPAGLIVVSEFQLSGPDVFTNTTTDNTPSFNAFTMFAGNTDTFQVVAMASTSLASGSTVTDTASVTSNTFDPNLGNNSSSVTSTIATSADLSVSKSGPALVTAGTSATYTITLTNNGPSDSQNVTVSDTLPTGLTVVSEMPISNPDGFTNTTTGNTPSFNAATMVAGNTDTFQVVAFAPSSLASGTPLSDIASVTASTFDPDLTNNTFTLGETVATSADLSVTKTGPAVITAGSSATYTITLTNLGPSDSAGVSLTDALPAGLTLVSEKQTSGTDAFVDNSTGNTATFNATTMISGNSDTFQVVALAASGLVAGSTVTDTASVSATTTDPDLTNNSSSVTSTIATSADLSVTKLGPATITAGTSATYTITVTNKGPSDSQTVTLTDALPAGLTRVSESQTGGPDVFVNNSTGNTASFSAVTVVAGNSDTFEVVAFAASSLTSGSTVTDTASVSSAVTPDPDLTNNSSSVTSTIATVADLTVTKSGPATASEGDTLTYGITLTNNGPSDAQGVTLTDSLPANVTLVSGTVGGVTGTLSGSTITFSLGTVTAGTTLTGTVVVQTTENGSTTDTVTVVSNTFDPTLADNTSSVTTAVAEPSINLTAFNVVATEFAPVTATVASFTHASGVEPAGAFSATVNWGDGTVTAGTITQSGATYTVTGSHTYTAQGSFGITVTVSEDNVAAQASATATVSESTTQGVTGKLETFICDTLEDDFHEAPTAMQCQSIKNALLVLEFSGAETLIKAKHINPLESFLLAGIGGKQEFTLIAGITAANGASLESAVTDIVNAFLLQSLTETLGPGVAGE
jgi:uncharacterized repeat protein (TIGR01451 family)